MKEKANRFIIQKVYIQTGV